MSGHFMCFQAESTSQRRTGEPPRFGAAAGSEYPTGAFCLISFCCRVLDAENYHDLYFTMAARLQISAKECEALMGVDQRLHKSAY